MLQPIVAMETMYTRLGTSQQPKLLNAPNERLFVVTTKPLTPLPTIAAEGRPEDTVEAAGCKKRSSVSPSRRREGLRHGDTRTLSVQMGKKVKKNGTTATMVKVMFPESQPSGLMTQRQDRHGGEMRDGRLSKPALIRRSDIKKLRSLEGLNHGVHDHRAELNEQENMDTVWNSNSFAQVHTMGGKKERELEDLHGSCMHPHVTRVDILFKPLAKSEELAGDGEHEPRITCRRRRGPVSRQLTKETPFGSRESLSFSAPDLVGKANKSDPSSDPDEVNGSTESSNTLGNWDSAAYTAKNTRIEFARTLHVPRPFVLRKDRRWQRRKQQQQQQEKARLCSRHLQHTRPVPSRRAPSPIHARPDGTTGCPDRLYDPRLVTPTRRRFEPHRPVRPTASRGVPRFRHDGMVIGPSHPHLHLAAINSVYNCNRLSFSGYDTPPVSEADSLECLDDFESFNLKVKMDRLIDKFKHLYPD